MKLENWGICLKFKAYKPPELCKYALGGSVYDNPNFEDGSIITTSHIVSFIQSEDRIFVHTNSGSVYEFGKASDEWLKIIELKGQSIIDAIKVAVERNEKL